MRECPSCKGKKEHALHVDMARPRVWRWIKCPCYICEATGEVPDDFPELSERELSAAVLLSVGAFLEDEEKTKGNKNAADQ